MGEFQRDSITTLTPTLCGLPLEILRLIINKLSQTELAFLTRVNKKIGLVAASQQWSSINIRNKDAERTIRTALVSSHAIFPYGSFVHTLKLTINETMTFTNVSASSIDRFSVWMRTLQDNCPNLTALYLTIHPHNSTASFMLDYTHSQPPTLIPFPSLDHLTISAFNGSSQIFISLLRYAAALPTLTSLELKGGAFTDDILPAFPQIVRLQLSHTDNLTPRTLLRLLRDSPNLTHLILHRGGWLDSLLSELCGMQGIQAKIRSLTLTAESTSSIHAAASEHLSNFISAVANTLTKLHLHQNLATNAYIEAIIPHLRNVIELHIGFRQSDGVGGKRVLRITKLLENIRKGLIKQMPRLKRIVVFGQEWCDWKIL